MNRLAGRFDQPADTPPIAIRAEPAPAQAPRPSASRRARSASGEGKATPSKPVANADAAHTKRTFYVRADLVDQVEAETRRLNYELGGVRLVEVLNAVLEAGLVDLPKIEADIRAKHAATQ